MKKTLIAALLAAAPFTTMAASAKSVGYLDVYYTDAELEVSVPGLGTGDDDGDGFGIRGAGKFSDQAFVYGEYQKNEYDDSNFEIQFLRAGLGYIFSQSGTVEVYGKAEVLNVDIDDGVDSDDETGFGVHGGIAFLPMPELRLFGEIGYIDVKDTDGIEYTLGAIYSVSSQFGVFVDYRLTDVEDEDNVELELSDLQLGVRFNF